MNPIEVEFSENEQMMETDFSEGTRFLNGKDGKDGKDGKNGAEGKSAYEVALQNGFAGSVGEWLESLKGKDGKHAYVFTTAGSSTAFTATIEGYTKYTKGDLFVMIPHVAATSTSPKLNINGLASYPIQRRAYNSTIKALRASGCIAKDMPELLVFTGSYFIALSQYQPYGGTDFYTAVSVSKGGTGKTSWTANRLIYASASSSLSQLYPPTEESVLMQKSTNAPYWKKKSDFTSGLMIYKGVHTETNKTPPMVTGHTYKFANDVTVVAPGDIVELTYVFDAYSSLYCYDFGIEIYSNYDNSCYTELTKIFPNQYVNGYSAEPFTLIIIPKSNEENPTPYVFHCTSSYSYEYEYDNVKDCWADISGTWQDGIYPTSSLSSGQYITLRIPTGTYPAGTYVCTGADWETLI